LPEGQSLGVWLSEPVKEVRDVRWTRREFVRGAAVGGGALLLGASAGRVFAQDAEPQAVPKRKFEKLDLEVPIMCLGTVPLTDYAPVLRGLEWDLHFVHTCSDYGGGKAIREVAKAIKDQRDKYILGIKTRLDYDTVKSDLEILGTDHVDITYFHTTDESEPGQTWVKDAFDRLKADGMTKGLGLTCHGNQAPVLSAGLEAGWYDVFMPGYNSGNMDQIDPIMEKAKDKGIGGMVMKSLAGIDRANAATQAPPVWATMLSKAWWTTVCWSVITDDDVDLLGKTALKWEQLVDEEKETARAAAAVGRICSSCDNCTRVCPSGVPVRDILRYEMYAVDYGWRRHARAQYAMLGDSQKALACTNCGTCVAGCKARLDIPARLAGAHRVLA